MHLSTEPVRTPVREPFPQAAQPDSPARERTGGSWTRRESLATARIRGGTHRQSADVQLYASTRGVLWGEEARRFLAKNSLLPKHCGSLPEYRPVDWVFTPTYGYGAQSAVLILSNL